MHQALVESLGPRLYDPHLSESELASQVRATLQEVIDSEQTPLSHADRTRIAQDVSDDILGHGPLEPYLRDPEITEIMVNGPNDIFIERDGKIFPVDAQLHRRRAPASHHRQDRRPRRPSRRRVEPDGRRPTSRRLACQRRRLARSPSTARC